MTTTGTTTKTNHYFRALLALLAALALAASLLVEAAKPAHASLGTLVVNSTGDQSDQNISDEQCDVDLATAGNQCTFRAAIENASFFSGLDVINFNIPGSDLQTIKPATSLGHVTGGPVIINAYTQPGAVPNTLAKGNNAVLKIELDGSNLGFDDGLHISDLANDSVIRGLVINNFKNNGIRISGQDISVEGNFIGTDPTGTIAEPNTNSGVLVRPFGNSVPINNTVGGERPDKRNVISGNFGGGVRIEEDSNNVVDNYIGTKKDRSGSLPNGFDGVSIAGGASNNTIGGATPASANTIAFNQGIGVSVSDNGVGNRVLSNSIFSNANVGIDLNRDGVSINDTGDADPGANTLQNFPVVTSAKLVSGATTIKGKLNSVPNQSFTIQFFASPEADVSGFGEGKIFLGKKVVTTDARASASFTFKPARKVGAGKVITATATDPNGNTSEFSTARKVVRG
jgi:hypothetical protein